MIITLLTDYGERDEFAGVCRAVIAGIAPDAQVVDITHGIPRFGVRHGAVALRNALPYAPIGVHVGIVDPQVGTERRAIALRCADGRILVGPDNGLLSLAWERCGGAIEAVDISRSPLRLEPVSATFHGRDVFAPVAAHIAAGAELLDAGEALPIEELMRVELPEPEVEEGLIVAQTLTVDQFGNVGLNLTHEQLAGSGLVLGAAVEIDTGAGRFFGTYAQTFADVHEEGVLVYEDAYKGLAIAINRGSAAEMLELRPDMQVRLHPR